MDLSQLEFFLAVARTEHFTQAAEELNVSTSSVSMAIAKLEDELGVQLFSKSGRRKYLNSTGIVFKNHIDQAMKQIQLAKSEALLADHTERNTVQIASDSLEALSVGEVAFLSRHPNFSIHQFSTSSEKVVSSILSHRVDFGFSHTFLENEDILSTPVLHERIGLLVNRRHPLAGRKQVRLSELADESFVLLQEGTSYRHMAEEFFASAGMNPHIVFDALDLHMLYKAVANNLGVAFLSDGGWHQNMVLQESALRSNLEIVPIEDAICNRTFYLSALRRYQLPPASWYFYTFLFEFFNQVEQEQLEFRKQLGWV